MLTRKERFNLTLSHQQPDRPPIRIYLTPEMRSELLKSLYDQSIKDAFELDFCGVGPSYKATIQKRGDAQWYNMWGVGFSKVTNSSGGTYDEATDLSLARISTMDDVISYPWPNINNYDFSTISEQCEEQKEYVICLGGAGTPDIINGVSHGRGMEQVLMDIALEDEVGVAIIDKRVDFYYEWCKRGLEAGGGKIDVLYLGEDLGSQKGPTVSPTTFDSFFRPRLEKFYKLAHDYGAYAMMHSCGSTRLLQPRLIDMGLDILDSVQPEPEGMNPEELKKEFGDKLTYCGMISTQQTLPHGTIEECRAEARHRIDVIGKSGGYIFAPAHCIQPDTPVENVLAIYEEVTGKRFI